MEHFRGVFNTRQHYLYLSHSFLDLPLSIANSNKILARKTGRVAAQPVQNMDVDATD